jgi:hypothetical protein
MKLRNVVIGFAAAMLLAYASAPAHAKGPKFTVVCVEKANTNVDKKGNDGSECFASSDGTGKGTAKAAGDKSSAEGDAATKGTSTATARGGSISIASSDTGCKAISHVSGTGGDGDATCDEHGTATTNVTGGGEAHTQAFGKCNAKATADAGSFANAVCGHDGTHANAVATKGGHAEGFDDKSPICTASAMHSTAVVHSSGGNCHAP